MKAVFRHRLNILGDVRGATPLKVPNKIATTDVILARAFLGPIQHSEPEEFPKKRARCAAPPVA